MNISLLGIRIVYLVMFFCGHLLQAAIHTETHTYILVSNKYVGKIVIINRKTGQEKHLNVGKGAQEIVIHQGFGYVVNQCSDSVSVIDLKTHEIVTTLSVGNEPRKISIHNTFGYVSNWGSDTVSVINLSTHTIVHTLKVCGRPVSMLIHDGFGYMPNGNAGNVSVIDLNNFKVMRKIKVGQSPTQIINHNGFGYVLNELSWNLSVIDLNTHMVTKTIPLISYPEEMIVQKDLVYIPIVPEKIVSVLDLKTNTITCSIPAENPRTFLIHENEGYVLNKDSKTISFIDLARHTITHTVKLSGPPQQMVAHDGHIYLIYENRDHEEHLLNEGYTVKKNLMIHNLKTFNVAHEMPLEGGLHKIKFHNGFVCLQQNDTFQIIDPNPFQVIQTIVFTPSASIDFSDTHLYLDDIKACTLPHQPLKLFQYPYSGIEGFYLDQDPDNAFMQFEEAALKKEYVQAKEHFKIALSFGNRKACTIAFKAFCHGIWGAKQDDTWANEFSCNLDSEYLQRLDPELHYPYDFRLAENQ